MILKSNKKLESVAPSLLIDEHEIIGLQSTKFLGILIYTSLTWTHHMIQQKLAYLVADVPLSNKQTNKHNYWYILKINCLRSSISL